MIRVNKKHSVQYKNGYYIIREHGKNEKGEEYTKGDQTYPSIESMILQCGFDIDFEYTDAALASKANYEKKWNDSHIKAKEKAALVK